ncbi:hypothetical protein EON63_16700 [archaeon]|nr:MAG: hypothetical protein EON63_16700 [archaeon]
MQVIPLKKGYVAIKNRSQRDIQENLTVRQGSLSTQVCAYVIIFMYVCEIASCVCVVTFSPESIHTHIQA